MEQLLTGLLLINGVDIYQEFGAFLAEEAQDKHTNYDALLAMPPIKAQPEVSIREEDGVRTPETLDLHFEARDIELQFAIVASGCTEFLQRYFAFVRFLRSGEDGWLTIRLTDIGLDFRVRLKEAAWYSQLTPFGPNCVAARFKVRFREPKPDFSPVQTVD